jgi:ferrous iron transport protein B
MNIRVVMALNMYDELGREGAVLDEGYLGRLLGIPIVPTTASQGSGIEAVLSKIIEVFEDKSEVSRHIHINYGVEIETAIDKIKETIVPNRNITDRFAPRYLAIKMIEDDSITKEMLKKVPNYARIEEVTRKYIGILEKEFKEDTRTIITNAKYGFIRGALKETYTEGDRDKRQLTNAIDTVLTHHWLGFPVLLLFMWMMFQATFSLGSYPMDWIEQGVDALGNWVTHVMPQGPLNDLIVDGVIAGVGGDCVLAQYSHFVLLYLPDGRHRIYGPGSFYYG